MSSSTPPPPPGDGKFEAKRETGDQLELENEKQAGESHEPSTHASSTVDDEKRVGAAEDNGPATEDGGKDPEPSQAAPSYPQGAELIFIMLALVLGIGLMSLDQTIVATAIPKITDDFHQINDISWYGSAYFLTLGAFQSQWGKIYKFFPLKPSFLIALFIFEVGSLICAVAPNATALIVGRAVAGLGASGIAPGVYMMAAFAAEPKKRPTYVGLIGVAYGVAAVLGPLIGGGFADGVTWRWCFYINLPLGGVVAFIILFGFKTPAAHKLVEAPLKEKIYQMDFPATALIMGASVCFILALQYGGSTYPWNSSVVIGLLVGFVVISIALVVLEIWQGERAMLTPRLMRQRTVWVNGVWGFFFAGSYFITLYYLPIYFQSIDNTSPIGSGVRNIPLIVLFSITTYLTGRAVTKWGIAAPLLTVGSAIVTITAGLFFTLGIGTSDGRWVGFQILAGFGYGIALQVPITVAQAFSAPTDIAPTTAIQIWYRSMGGAFLLSAAESAFVNQFVQRLRITAPNVNHALATATGATELRSVFHGAQLYGVLQGYEWGIKVAFALSIGTCGICIPISLFSKWDNINKLKASKA